MRLYLLAGRRDGWAVRSLSGPMLDCSACALVLFPSSNTFFKLYLPSCNLPDFFHHCTFLHIASILIFLIFLILDLILLVLGAFRFSVICFSFTFFIHHRVEQSLEGKFKCGTRKKVHTHHISITKSSQFQITIQKSCHHILIT